MEPQDLVRGTVKLVSLPEVFIKVNSMVDDPTCSASDIGKYISKDPALTAKLLKIANSPLYGFPSRIDTVSRSITVIGTRGLRDLILASSTIAAFAKFDSDLIDINRFWSHSLYCGVLARLLATKCNALHTEPFFVSGLLHDIGKLIIHSKLPEMARKVHMREDESNLARYELENEVIGFSHATVGSALLRAWKLPVNIQDAVEHHHTPALAKESPLGAAIIHIADAITNSNGYSISTTGNNRIDQMAWTITGLSHEIIENFLDEAEIQFKISMDLFFQNAA